MNTLPSSCVSSSSPVTARLPTARLGPYLLQHHRHTCSMVATSCRQGGYSSNICKCEIGLSIHWNSDRRHRNMCEDVRISPLPLSPHPPPAGPWWGSVWGGPGGWGAGPCWPPPRPSASSSSSSGPRAAAAAGTEGRSARPRPGPGSSAGAAHNLPFRVCVTRIGSDSCFFYWFLSTRFLITVNFNEVASS